METTRWPRGQFACCKTTWLCAPFSIRKSRPVIAVLSPLPGGFPIMNVSERLLTQLARRDYVPAAAEAIAKQWRLKPKDRRNFFRTIDELPAAGRICHIKGDRLCLPREADLVTGTINFRQKGSAMVYPEVKATEPRKA